MSGHLDPGTAKMRCGDVLIVGGGPAGSSCARALGRAGLEVLLVDKAVFPRHKVCAGWITPAVFEALEVDAGDYARERTCQPIRGFRAGRIGGHSLRVDYGHPVSYGIRRCEFDEFLLRRSGARLQLGEAVGSIEREERTWVVNGRLRAPMLVGAGGHFCPVARRLAPRGGNGAPLVAAQEIEFPLDAGQRAACRVEAELPELYFCSDLAGYGWCFRKGDYLNVGLGREDRAGLGRQVAAFYDWLAAAGRIPAHRPGRFRGHAYLLRAHSPRRLVDDGLLLLGDAAGLAYAQSGEGIRPAVESALVAAGVIVAAGGDYRRDRLQAYERQITARFGRRKPAASAAKLVPSPVRRTLAVAMLSSRWFLRHVVLDRWFLRRHQPPLTLDVQTSAAANTASLAQPPGGRTTDKEQDR